MFVHLVSLNVQNWSALISHFLRLPYQSKYMVTVKKLVLHLVDICSLVQNIESRFATGWSRFVAGLKIIKVVLSRQQPGTWEQGHCYV